MQRYDVAISGCGPVGAMLSLLLAKGGLKVLVVEKELKVFNKPRAIVLDSEAIKEFYSFVGLLTSWEIQLSLILGLIISALMESL